MAPFILAMAALVWDLRQYIAYRTDVTREMFVVAEVIANETGTTSADNPIPIAARRAMGRLADGGAGKVAVTVVTRGDRRLATATAPDLNCDTPGEWCLPRVTAAWPATGGDEGTWGGGGDCAAFTTSLPAAGEHFPADLAVLPNEVAPDVSPTPPHQSWLSRNLRQEEWWVIVDTCVHPDPGLFGGWVLNGLAFFDTSRSALVFSRRAAWGSVHDYSDCNWCP